MTEIFYKTKYSNHKIDVDKYEEIGKFALEIIDFLKNLEVNYKINPLQGN